jgi:hypothetical protein
MLIRNSIPVVNITIVSGAYLSLEASSTINHMFSFITFFVIKVLSLLISYVFAGIPISSLSVTLRGQTYSVSDVSTVQELQEQVTNLSGIPIKQQGRVIFGGKKLTSDTVLDEAGIADGAHVNIVPSTSSKKKKSSTATVASSKDNTKESSSSSTSSTSSPGPDSNFMSDLLKKSGLDSKDLDEMMKSMGGSGDGPKSVEEGMKAMKDAMNSPILQQMLKDPEKLEQSRQMILNNPMLKSMMSNMPGMNELLNDKDSWREAMQMAAELYKNMDSDTLMKAMMGGAEAAQNAMGQTGTSAMNNGLFDGSTLFKDSTSTENKVTNPLDELEDDE